MAADGEVLTYRFVDNMNKLNIDGASHAHAAMHIGVARNGLPDLKNVGSESWVHGASKTVPRKSL